MKLTFRAISFFIFLLLPHLGCKTTAEDKSLVKVIGGKEGNAPVYFVSLVLHTDPTTPYCGGTLITPHVVITAAHCLDMHLKFDVVIGATTKEDFINPDKIVSVKGIRIHPEFSRVTGHNDLGLVFLDDAKVAKNIEHIHPITINRDQRFPEQLHPNQIAVMGWGQASNFGDVSPNNFLHTTVSVIPLTQCRKTGPKDFETIADSVLCGGNMDFGGSDTCRGDSGGPAIGILPNSQIALMGLTSWGPATCGLKGQPTVYTRISSYVPWIEEAISNNQKSEDREISPIRATELVESHCYDQLIAEKNNVTTEDSPPLNATELTEYAFVSFTQKSTHRELNHILQSMPPKCSFSRPGNQKFNLFYTSKMIDSTLSYKAVLRIAGQSAFFVGDLKRNLRTTAISCTPAGMALNDDRQGFYYDNGKLYSFLKEVDESETRLGQRVSQCEGKNYSYQLFKQNIDGEKVDEKLLIKISTPQFHNKPLVVQLKLTGADAGNSDVKIFTLPVSGQSARRRMVVENNIDYPIYTWTISCPTDINLTDMRGRQYKSQKIGEIFQFAYLNSTSEVGTIPAHSALSMTYTPVDGDKKPLECLFNNSVSFAL